MSAWDQLRAEHLNGFTAGLLAAGASPGYASDLYRAIQQFVKWCLIEEEMTRDPLAATTRPQVPEHPVPVLSPDQLRTAQGL